MGDQELKDLQRMFNKEKEELEKKFDEERLWIVNQVDEETAQLKSEIQRLKKQHADEKLKFMHTFEEQVATLVADTAAAAISENFKVERKTLEDKHKAEIEELRSQLKADFSAEYKKKKRKYEDAIVDIFEEQKHQLEESMQQRMAHQVKELELQHKQ